MQLAVFIIAMFIELKENDFRLNVDLELTLVKVASRYFNCSMNFLFWLNWDVTKVKNLFNIWVEVKLFCFMIDLLLESKAISFWLVELKFENWRKSICISITRLILFIHVFSRLIIKLSFDINLLTRLKYSISIFWLNLNTWFQHSDSIWYRFQVNTWFEFSTQLVKKSNMMSRELNIEIFPVFRLCIIFLHYLFGRKS